MSCSSYVSLNVYEQHTVVVYTKMESTYIQNYDDIINYKNITTSINLCQDQLSVILSMTISLWLDMNCIYNV